MNDVNATAVDVASIIKMVINFKTIVLEGKVAGGGKSGLEKCVIFIEYFVVCILMSCLV